MPSLRRQNFSIHYEVSGPSDGVPLVLIAGLGEQIGSVEYPDEQCELYTQHNFKVIKLDNRDMGLSVPNRPIPAQDITATLESLNKGNRISVPYTMWDMADDVIAVLDALGIDQANVAGASMGGYIARWIAIRHPERVTSLQVIMSGSGAGRLDDAPQLDPKVTGRLAEMATYRDRAVAIDYHTKLWKWLWGEGYPFEADWVSTRVAFAYDRSYRPDGIARQILAVIATESLWSAQAAIQCPTLVIHGDEDPCFGPAHGQAIAKGIPGARLWLDPKMGHTLHREQWQEMAERAAVLARH